MSVDSIIENILEQLFSVPDAQLLFTLSKAVTATNVVVNPCNVKNNLHSVGGSTHALWRGATIKASSWPEINVASTKGGESTLGVVDCVKSPRILEDS